VISSVFPRAVTEFRASHRRFGNYKETVLKLPGWENGRSSVNESTKSSGIATIQFLSKVMMLIGGLVFLFGDRFLRTLFHFGFLTGEVIGILSGLLLCALGFALGKSVGIKGS